MKIELSREEIEMICYAIACKVKELRKNISKFKTTDNTEKEIVEPYRKLFWFFDELLQK